MRRSVLRLCGLWLGTAAMALACGGSETRGGKGNSDAGTNLGDGSSVKGTPGDGSGSDVSSGVDSSNDATAGSGDSSAVDAGPIVAPQPLSPYIVVDQFGYRTTAEKIAVIKSPVTGFDATGSFTPGATYALVDAHSSAKVLEAAPTVWNAGGTDSSSGDKAWWFDFSSVTTPGAYFVLDETAGVRSAVLRIADNVYSDVLTQSIRMLYYQRDGIAKEATYAGADWADGFAHPQDVMCGLYSDGSGPKDLHGGWFDAGDQNRYTNWAASDVIELFRAYLENPSAFSDDYNIPESGNGIPDLLDEAKWELDWIARMQNTDGSVLSIAGHQGASPPSTDTSPCQYGPANTSATLTSAAAFAYGSIVFKSVTGASTVYPGYADGLATRAANAWTWADANPEVIFMNSGLVGAGEQEVPDDAGRVLKKLQAAVFLFELTGTASYQTYFDANYTPLLADIDPFHMEPVDTALEYTKIKGATGTVTSAILASYKSAVEGGTFFGTQASNADPYLADLEAYTWGSNQDKAGQGNMYTDMVSFGVDATANADATRYAERYIHYVHGVNPLSLVYLSNMQGSGATTSVTRFFHTWFAHGSEWDAVGVSKYGPPPGYLVGGPNPTYAWDPCCPAASCGGDNALCGSASPSPPSGEPDQKSYKDFNDSYPLDSWQISEPDDGYQAQYIRLLSKFVP
jgi:endoglucanase